MLTGTVVIPGMGKKEISIKTKNGKPNDIVVRTPSKEPIGPIVWDPRVPNGPWAPIGLGPITDSSPVIRHPIVPIGTRPIVRPLGPMTPDEASEMRKKDFFTKVFETHKRRVDKFKAPIVGK